MKKIKHLLKLVALTAAVMLVMACPPTTEPVVPVIPTAETVKNVTFSTASETAVAPGTVITLSTETSGATIYYTVDNSVPTTSSLFGAIDSSSATITIDANTTIKAFASKAGMSDSEITSAIYTIDPTFSFPVKFYSDSACTTQLSATAIDVFTVYLKSSTTTDVKIYYTIDNSEPDATKTEYNSVSGVVIPAVTAMTTTTIKAKVVGIANGMKDSTVASIAITTYPPNKVIFTEYVEGASNNKYIEISNVGTEAVNLSDYTLTMNYYTSSTNVYDATKNAVKTLTGILPAGKSVIYANSGYSTTTFTVANVLQLHSAVVEGNTASWQEKVTDSSNITYFNGNDTLTLKRAGVTVDHIGPADVSEGVGSLWAAETRLIRKPGATGSTTTFNANDWAKFGFATGNVVGDDYSAGSYLAVASGNTLRQFAINGYRGTFSTTNIAITLPSGDKASLIPDFASDAEYVRVGATDITSAVSTVNFSSPVSITVGTTGGTDQTYTVTVTVVPPVELTSTNYDFDGGLAAAVTKIGTSTAAVNIFDAPATSVTLTGVVTALSGTNKFFIQDMNRGLCFFKTGAFTAGLIKVGDKVTITARKGMYYNSNLYEVTDFDSITSANVATVVTPGRSIYVLDGNTTSWSTADGALASGETLNRAYKFSGYWMETLASGNSYVGKFGTDGTTTDPTRLYTNANSYVPVATAPSLMADFYGVIDIKRTGTTGAYLYNKVMLIGESDQYRPQ